MQNPYYLLVASAVFGLSSCSEQPSKVDTSCFYETIVMQRTDATIVSQYAATVVGKEHVEIRPQINGVITSICVNEGSLVHKGQTLFIIDQTPYLATLEKAKANLSTSEAKLSTAHLTVESKKNMLDANVISDYDYQLALNEYEEAKAAVKQSKADVLNAQNNLSYTVIKSPVNGFIGMIPYKVGTLVSSNMSEPLVTVASNRDMSVYFSLSENQVLDLQSKGELSKMPPVSLQLGNGLLYEPTGRIDAISGIVDKETGAVTLRASFQNQDNLLRDGSSATILLTNKRHDCIVIPQEATFEIQDKIYVYQVVDGKAKSRLIETSQINNGKQYVVESGLNIGDTIIADGVGLIQEGVVVKTK